MDCEHDEEEEAPALMKMTVEGDVSVAHILRGVVERVREDTKDEIESCVRETIASVIQNHTEAKVEKLVDEVLAQGFEQRDEYGRTLPAQTLRDKVIDVIRKPRSYSNRSAIESLIDDAIRRDVEKMVKEEVETARTKFREQVDTVLGAKLNEVLRAALGVKL